MRIRVPHIISGWLFVLLLLPSIAHAQEDNCPAVVSYYEGTGNDVGQCTGTESLCKTLDYALEQGKSICPGHTIVYYENPNNTYVQVEWRPPPASVTIKDTLWRVGHWLGPALGLVLGFLAAWIWTNRSKGRAI